MSDKSVELSKSISQAISRLAELTSDATKSAGMQAYVEMAGRFYRYSLGNIMLILISNPAATHVAGFHKWHEFNRHVRKGEHGITILAPCTYKNTDDPEGPPTLVGFRCVTVFDVLQTEGDPLPEIPNWSSETMLETLHIQLCEYAKSLGIVVKIANLGKAQGRAQPGMISLSPGAGTKTLIHEVAHVLLHQGNSRFGISVSTREIEAEAVACVVAAHYGLEDESGPNYLALWDADPTKIAARAGRIQWAAKEIITHIALEGVQEE